MDISLWHALHFGLWAYLGYRLLVIIPSKLVMHGKGRKRTDFPARTATSHRFLAVNGIFPQWLNI